MRATLEAEVVVVGAGPAGITLALELADGGHHVLLVESGEDSYSADAQRLGDATGNDTAHAPMSLATRRQLGGASNLWAGRCVPFDPIDLQPRELVGDVRWPVAYDELEGYFARACEWCRCGASAFDAGQIPTLAGRELIPGWPQQEIRSTALERWSLPTNFGRLYRAQLRAAARITLLTNLTCTEIVCRADGRGVDHLSAQTLTGSEVQLRARRYVLACGGVESTRLLLASNRHHAGGIGNHAGHLGRWYMSHVGACIAQAHFNTPAAATIYGFERDGDGVYVRRRFTFSADYTLANGLPNVAMWLENPEISDPSHGNAVLSSIYLILTSPLGRYVLAEGTRRRKLDTNSPVSWRRHVRNVVRRLPQALWFTLTFGYRRFLQPGHKAPGVFVPSASNVYRLYYHGEHLPHQDSRVTLSGERDALGMPRVRTSLRFADEEIESAMRVHEHFDRYLRRHGLGHLEYLSGDPRRSFREQLFDGYHQAGTTRMSATSEEGVLDSRLAVHGFEDLFVVSSSAFVTSGQANSTFMVIVFALRLADHLHRTLRRDVAASRSRHVVRDTKPYAGRATGTVNSPRTGVNRSVRDGTRRASETLDLEH